MRKFLIKISYTVLPVWLVLVTLAVYLWMTNDKSGDLMRLGLIAGGTEYTDSMTALALPTVYYSGEDDIDVLRVSSCDVLVIGDSFSHGGGVGKQGDFVNYLAHDGGLNVTVFTPQDPAVSSPVQLAFDALNVGGVDSTVTRNLVVQEVERYIVARHDAFVTTHGSIPKPEPGQNVDDNTKPGDAKSASPLLRVKDYLFYHLFGANPIYRARLSRPMFGGAEPATLYFYNEDVKDGIDPTGEQLRRIADDYRLLMAKAREKGVNVVIVVACDKYDIYQRLIADNPYPAKTLNEDIARLMAGDTDRMVFTKQVLLPMVERGEKDVYLYNDTHWSPGSSRIVARTIIDKLR